MYYLVDMYNDKTNFIDGIDSDTCQKILNSSTIISETLEFYYLGKCVSDSFDTLIQWSYSANPSSNYIMRNLHTAERLVRGLLLIMHIQSMLLHIICEMFPSIVKISFTDSTLLLELVYLVMYKSSSMNTINGSLLTKTI